MVIQKKKQKKTRKCKNLEDRTSFLKLKSCGNMKRFLPSLTNERKGGALVLDLYTFFAILLRDNCRFYFGRMNVVEFRNEKRCKSPTALHSYEYPPVDPS